MVTLRCRRCAANDITKDYGKRHDNEKPWKLPRYSWQMLHLIVGFDYEINGGGHTCWRGFLVKFLTPTHIQLFLILSILSSHFSTERGDASVSVFFLSQRNFMSSEESNLSTSCLKQNCTQQLNSIFWTGRPLALAFFLPDPFSSSSELESVTRVRLRPLAASGSWTCDNISSPGETPGEELLEHRVSGAGDLSSSELDSNRASFLPPFRPAGICTWDKRSTTSGAGDLAFD